MADSHVVMIESGSLTNAGDLARFEETHFEDASTMEKSAVAMINALSTASLD